MARRRLGVVLLIPPPLDAEVDGLRRAVGDGSLDRIQAHLTLVPPVNVRDDELDAALDVMRDAGAATRPFTARIGPPATFHPVTPVVYLGVAIERDAEAIAVLRRRVFVAPLARELTYPFVAHVTLADGMDPDRIPQAVSALSDYTVDVTFDRVHILEEGPGRVWESIGEAAFAAPAVIGRGALPLEIAVAAALSDDARRFATAEWARFNRERYGEDVKEPDAIALTARRNGAIVGVATGWTGNGTAHLKDLIVAASCRGEGVGSQLLARFVSEAAAAGAKQVSLRTESGGPSEGFYKDRGWTTIARLPRYNYGRDFVHMVRPL